MNYCKNCGKELEENEVCACEGTAKKEPLIPLNKRMIYGVSAAIALLISIVLIVVFTGKDPNNGAKGNENIDGTGLSGEIDPFDDEYITVHFDGFDNEGTVSVSINDREALIERLIGEIYADDDAAISAYWQKYLYYDEHISYSASIESGLKNGDKVTLTFIVPESAKSNLKCNTKEYTVSGLKNLQTVDIFDGIQIVYEGVNGTATPKLVKQQDTDVLNDCVFSITPQYFLSENDVITITITNAEILKEQYSVVPLELSRTYTVPKLATYAASASQLPVLVIQGLAEQFYADRLEALRPDKDFEYKNIEYHGTYFYVSNGTGSSWNAPYENILKIDVVYEIYMWGTSHGTRHDCLYFTNISVNYDGTISLTYEDHDSYIKSFDEDYYDITPITLAIDTNVAN